MDKNYQTALFAGGCFWCVESVFSQIKGVDSAICGYTDGITENPTYEDICAGISEHAEAVKVTFDPDIIDYTTLLDIFFAIHDPTQLNRQGHDVGTQYRSAIFYDNNTQLEYINQKLSDLNKDYDVPIVTSVKPVSHFYIAEEYHQGYFLKDPSRPGYCQMVVSPKFSKAKVKFSELWK